jgi:D-serine deaminase-like pyridoxal phosphate-dependent protein
MRRRQILQSAAGLAATTGGALLWAPRAAGSQPSSAHDAYFSRLNELLKRAGPGRPVMLIDVERMQHNVDVISRSVGPDKTYRVVVKSLPSVPLLEHVMRRAKTDALMVFHQPFLNAVAERFPDADVLMGKPMPVAAARTFYRELGDTPFDAAGRLQWLIDSRERLLQYQALARELGVHMRVNVEIDVGLHRGGLPEPAALDALLNVIRQDPQHLSFAGFMGYEPHLTGLKAQLDDPPVRQVLDAYRGFMDGARAAGMALETLTLNGAGSHTLRIYERDHTMNDLSAGSGVVMPTDFDTFHLAENRPALFIATPILKRYDGNPFLPAGAELSPDMERLYYIYGGYWKAQMVSPAETGKPIYQSTNQSPVTTSRSVDLQVDDYMFLRPTQSEFVMLQFGDLLAVQDGEIAARWPVFQQTG